MATFDDLATSLALRDIINGLIADAMQEQRPKPRYATVISIDNRATGKCTIQYNGESGYVQVNMPGPQPTSAGQQVRVEGIGTDKYITAVIGQEWMQLQDVLNLMKAI
jgi:hypothetical protein